ncbi:ATP-binding protein [Nocardia terpenica]|uniref:histidine kinase n=1 Tax=Nocardia terpenica TaxID=455432 RepID=A0A161X7J7_9NOCA|nr:ATP-binding protein [Nocardia terpenica]KZM68968.1 histidine kinase [Nocardia terpenica]NQE87950.1 HAMP domain-containing protein [Nocardia terpenica]
MRDAARSGGKRWALSSWDLRWKVTAVLAVPLLVAVVLGASRIAAQFSDSSRLDTAVQHVEAIPAVTGLSAASAVISGEQMVQLGANQSLVQDADLTQLDAAIAAAEKAAPRLDGVPGGRAAIDGMINNAKGVRQGGSAPSKTTADALAQEEAIRQNSVRTVEAIVSTIADPGVEAAKLRLVDSLNTRAVLISEAAGMADAMRGNPKDGIRDFQIAANTERQMLGILAHRFKDGDPTIADLTSLVNNRIQMTSGAQAASGQVPLQDLRQSAVDSLSEYQKVVSQSSSDIVARVNTLADNARSGAIRYAAIVVATILAALVLAVLIARSLIVPLRKLRLAALRVAEHDLGHEVSRLRDGASPEDVPLEPMPVHTEEEIGQLARAVDDIHGQALRLAADQAAMRTQVNDMFETLARRSKSLVDHQLSLIEAMEYDEKDPRLLENLFRLDHLAARMRRNGDNLLILAGTRQRRTKSAPVEIADVLRAAISEVEDYERVKLGATPRGAITEPAASDLAHLFAELLDNALRASPPETDVKFTFAQAHDQGLLIEVADRGIGMPPAEMAEINRRLESIAEVGPDTARHMGLFVVGRLAERHGLTVRLRPTIDTARDPGVTVVVHVPKAIIVAPAGGTVTVPAQVPGLQSPTPQQSSTLSSMQMRAVTRTPSGNVMVTVDPGVSGPIPAGSERGRGADRTAAASSGNATTGSPSVGLPQRQPGTAVPGGLPQRQPGANGPTVRHGLVGGDAKTGLPQREPGARGPLAPPAQPGGALPPQRQPGSGTPAAPQPGLAANMLKRQPGAGGQQPPRPSGPTGLPQRQAGGSGVPPREPGAGGVPPREPGSGGLPQRGLPQRPPAASAQPGVGAPPERPTPGLPSRDSGETTANGATGLPQRDSGRNGLPPRRPGIGGLPQREPAGGDLPQRGTEANGLPQRDAGSDLPQGLTGLPQRDSGLPGRPRRDSTGTGLPQRDGGAPQRDSSGGLPTRDGGLTGLPQRDSVGGGVPPRDGGLTGLPQRDAGSTGLPSRDAGSTGLPSRDAGPTGLPQRDAAGNGLPQRDPSGLGLPQRDPSGLGLPKRDSAGSGLPQRDSGLPQRDGGAPQRDSSGGLPSREGGLTGLPPRDGGLTGLPQREAGSTGVPSREGGPTGLPQRDAGPSGSPRRDAGSGLHQRDSGLPSRRDAGSGLPQRDSGAAGLPPRRDPAGNGLPQRDPSGLGLPKRDLGAAGLPQREAGGTGLPQRDAGGNGLPQREPNGLGLPQRQPGADLPPRPTPTPGLSLPEADADGDSRERGRHSFRSNPQKTASFFQTRLQPADDTGSVMGGTPIFAEMMSAWLSDPNQDRSQVAASFESPGDEGWQAARRAIEAQPEKRTAAGLPQRDPGNRLVPGGVNGNADRTPQSSRDPESIRSSLSRHQQGVRDGRAMRAMNLTGDKGDR